MQLKFKVAIFIITVKTNHFNLLVNLILTSWFSFLSPFLYLFSLAFYLLFYSLSFSHYFSLLRQWLFYFLTSHLFSHLHHHPFLVLFLLLFLNILLYVYLKNLLLFPNFFEDLYTALLPFHISLTFKTFYFSVSPIFSLLYLFFI